MGEKKKKKIVHLVTLPVFEYNDEGFYTADGRETVAVCKTHEDALRWMVQHGWSHISDVVDDLEYRDDEPDVNDYEDFEEYKADCIVRWFSVKPVEVIRYG